MSKRRKDYRWNWIGGTNGSWSVSNEKRYIYDGMLVVQERNSANTPSVTYTRGNDLSGTLQGAGGWTSQVLTVRCPEMDDRFAKLSGGMLARSQSYSAGNWLTHHYYHADGNGNITYLVNSSQTLGASYKYNPFGGTISSSGTYAGANRYRFSSKEVNVSNGTYYYGYRWYHPNLQRWLNRDPIQEKGNEMLRATVGLLINGYTLKIVAPPDRPYSFAENNAISAIDSWGLILYAPPSLRNPLVYIVITPVGTYGAVCTVVTFGPGPRDQNGLNDCMSRARSLWKNSTGGCPTAPIPYLPGMKAACKRAQQCFNKYW